MFARPSTESRRCVTIVTGDAQELFDSSDDKQWLGFHRPTNEQLRDHHHRGIWSSFSLSFRIMESSKLPSPLAKLALVLSTLGQKTLLSTQKCCCAKVKSLRCTLPVCLMVSSFCPVGCSIVYVNVEALGKTN